MKDNYYIPAKGGKLQQISKEEADRIKKENMRLISTSGSLEEIISAWERVQFVIQL